MCFYEAGHKARALECLHVGLTVALVLDEVVKANWYAAKLV